MPAPKIRKQRVAIALKEQERLKQQVDEARRAQAIELIKQNQKQVKKVEETTPKVKVVKSAQKKTKTTKSSSKKRRTK